MWKNYFEKKSYVDIDECSLGNLCGDVDHTTCQNTEGGFTCVCVAGFSPNDVTQMCEGKLWSFSSWHVIVKESSNVNMMSWVVLKLLFHGIFLFVRRQWMWSNTVSLWSWIHLHQHRRKSTPAHAWQGLKWLMEAAWVCSHVYSTNFFSIIYTYLFTAMFSTVKLELQKVQHFTAYHLHMWNYSIILILLFYLSLMHI